MKTILIMITLLALVACSGGGGGGGSSSGGGGTEPPVDPPPPGYVAWTSLEAAIGTYRGDLTHSSSVSWNDPWPTITVATGNVVTFDGVYPSATSTLTMTSGDVFDGTMRYNGNDYNVRVVHQPDGDLFFYFRSVAIYQMTPTGGG